MDYDHFRMALRAERFDEVVPQKQTPVGDVGITGMAIQVPAEIYFTDDVVLSFVPTYLSRTTTQKQAVLNVGVGFRANLTEKFGIMTEYYPTPSKVKVPGRTSNAGFAAGITYKTFKHRFTLMGTNATGTTANQVLSGDYGGEEVNGAFVNGPRSSAQWSLGFNVSRVF